MSRIRESPIKKFRASSASKAAADVFGTFSFGSGLCPAGFSPCAGCVIFLVRIMDPSDGLLIVYVKSSTGMEFAPSGIDIGELRSVPTVGLQRGAFHR
jgi:hypothetical protein